MLGNIADLHKGLTAIVLRHGHTASFYCGIVVKALSPGMSALRRTECRKATDQHENGDPFRRLV